MSETLRKSMADFTAAPDSTARLIAERRGDDVTMRVEREDEFLTMFLERLLDEVDGQLAAMRNFLGGDWDAADRVVLTEVGWELAAAEDTEIEIEVPVEVVIDALDSRRR